MARGGSVQSRSRGDTLYLHNLMLKQFPKQPITRGFQLPIHTGSKTSKLSTNANEGMKGVPVGLWSE